MKPKLPAGTLDGLWADPNNWRAGVIYVCKDDPRLIVPKRPRWGGWTVNFAHSSAWLLLLAVMLSVIIAVSFLAAAGMSNPWVWIASSIAIVIVVCVLSAILSSPKWYENAGDRTSN